MYLREIVLSNRFLLLAMVRAEAWRILKSSLNLSVPFATITITIATGFLYLVGAHSYDSMRYLNGLSIHMIGPSLYDILLRGVESGGLGSLLMIFFVFSLLAIFFFHMVSFDALKSAGITDSHEDDNNKKVIHGIAKASLFITLVPLTLLLIPILLGIPRLLAFSQFSHNTPSILNYLLFPDIVEYKFEYDTNHGIYCGIFIADGNKGIAIVTNVPNTMVIIRPEDVREIKLVASCPPPALMPIKRPVP